MKEHKNNDQGRRPWINPEIHELDFGEGLAAPMRVRETLATPNRGEDLGGNADVDSSRC